MFNGIEDYNIQGVQMINLDQVTPADKAATYLASELYKQFVTTSKNIPCYSEADATTIANHFKRIILSELTKPVSTPQTEFIVQFPEAAATLLIGKIDTSITPIKATGLTEIMHGVGKTYSVGFFTRCSCQLTNGPNPIFQIDPKKMTDAKLHTLERSINTFIRNTLNCGILYKKNLSFLQQETEKALRTLYKQNLPQDDLALHRISMALALGHTTSWDGQRYSTLNREDMIRLYHFFSKYIMMDVFTQLSAEERKIISTNWANWANMICGEKIAQAIMVSWGSRETSANFRFTKLLDFSFKHIITAQPQSVVNGPFYNFYKLMPDAELLKHKQAMIEKIVESAPDACLMLDPIYKKNKQQEVGLMIM